MIRQFPLIVVTICAFVSHLPAANRYMTVSGAGAKTGDSWANACPGSSMATLVNTTMAAGDTLYIGSGNYADLRPVITSSGTAEARKSLIGVDQGSGLPVFYGTQNTRGYIGVTITGAGYWTIKNLDIQRRDVGLSSY